MRLGFSLFLAVCCTAVPLGTSCVNTRILASLSEQIGEVASMAAIESMIPGAKQLPSALPGDSKQGQFDRVYIDGDVIYVVKSKGGRSNLGSRKDLNNQQSQQGTPEYIASVIQNMADKVKDGMEDPRYLTDQAFADHIDLLSDTVDKLIEAQDAGKIVSLQVSQRVDSNGNLAPNVEVKRFENYSEKAPGFVNAQE
jgi:hypothetical protein